MVVIAHLRILIIFLLQKYANSMQLHIFKDLMKLYNLHHGIIGFCQQELIQESLFEPLEIYALKFYQIGNEKNFKNISYFFSPSTGIYLDLSCKTSIDFLAQASHESFFNSSQKWLIFTKNIKQTEKVLKNYKINIDADIMLATIQSNETIKLFDVYKVCHPCGTDLIVDEMGIWTRRDGFKFVEQFQKKKIDRRKNFGGPIFKSAVVLTAVPKNMTPFDYMKSYEYRHLDPMHRKGYHVLKILSELYNFRIDPVITDSWGIIEKGKWNGVLGMILREEVIMSISPLRLTPKRIITVRFMPRIHVEYVSFIFRHPRNSVIQNIFLEPFQSMVWYCAVGVTVLGIFMMAAIIHFGKDYVTEEINSEHTFNISTVVVVGLTFLQGSNFSFRMLSAKTLIVTICIFSFFLYQFYSAFIVGSLLMVAPRSITNLLALYNSSLAIGMEDIPYNHEFFINTTSQFLKDMWIYKIKTKGKNNILPLDQGLKRVASGGYAMHVQLTAAYTILKDILTESEFCDLQEIPLFTPFNTHPILHKGSPYKKHVAVALMLLKERGILAYHDKLWQVHRTQCDGLLMNDPSVDLEHFGPALVFLFISIILSAIILALEIIYNKIIKAVKTKPRFC